MKILHQLKTQAMLNRGNHNEIPQADIIQTYRVARPILDKVKQGSADHPDLVTLYEFFTVTSFICDHMQKQTVDSAKNLLQQRKQAVFDGGLVMLEMMAAIREGKTRKTTGPCLKSIHDGYIAACEILENATVGAYTAAKAEIAQLEVSGAIRAAKAAKRKKGNKR